MLFRHREIVEGKTGVVIRREGLDPGGRAGEAVVLSAVPLEIRVGEPHDEEADLLAAEKLKSERAKIDQEAAAVETRLAEAQRLKDEIERQQKAAAQEAERQHRLRAL